MSQAGEAGIQFERMRIGTSLVTKTVGTPSSERAEKYIGRRADFHVTETSTRGKDGHWKTTSMNYYDTQGRLVRREGKNGTVTYSPYSCLFVLGDCKHEYQYPNPFKNNKPTKNSQAFSNRLDGDELIISYPLASGKTAKIPFRLGPYNLRVSSEYRNQIGQPSGFQFIELIEPEGQPPSSTGAKTPPPTQPSSQATNTDHCTRLYDRLAGQAPGDIAKCTPTIQQAKFESCVQPANSPTSRLPSRVAMILDASGSMSGKIDGEQKMTIAKREAQAFLTRLPKDIAVGLIVYGHKGSNDEAGKALSCSSIEWAVPVGTNRNAVQTGIEALQPTGWTPLAGSLRFAESEIGKLKTAKPQTAAPTVFYVVSDGRETCGGDPVAAARSLHLSGAGALINVIGFDLDAETRAELEKISEAGGGQYFPARDSAALAAHLSAAADALNSLARFEYCVDLNQGLAEAAYNNARNSVPACFVRESQKKTRDFILEEAKSLSPPEDQACAKTVRNMAHAQSTADNKKMMTVFRQLTKAQTAAGQQARQRSVDQALPAR